MLPLLLPLIGAAFGVAYGLAKGTGKTPGGKARYCVMCALLGIVVGGLAYGGWALAAD